MLRIFFFSLFSFLFLISGELEAASRKKMAQPFSNLWRMKYDVTAAATPTPSYVTENLILLIDWNDPSTSQSVTGAEFQDRSGSGYNMCNFNQSFAPTFNEDFHDYRVTFDGVNNIVTGDFINQGDPMAVTSQFTIMTMIRYDSPPPASRNIFSKFISLDAARSQWIISSCWQLGVAPNFNGQVAFSVWNDGVNNDATYEANNKIISSNISVATAANLNQGSVVCILADPLSDTFNIVGDYDDSVPDIDGVNNSADMQLVAGSKTLLQEDGSLFTIGGAWASGMVPFLPMRGFMGPVLMYSVILGQDEIDRNSQWLQSVTTWSNY